MSVTTFLPAPGEFWLASGHALCDRTPEGFLQATPDLWRAFLARPELLPPEEACDAERALHARLMTDPLGPIETEGLADPDAAENWQVFGGFRDRVMAQPTLEAAWCALYRGGVGGVPPPFLQMLTHLVTRAALDGVGDPYVLRAAECLFRTQRAAITQGATLLADEEVLAARAADADLGPLGRLLTEAGATPREAEFDVLNDVGGPQYAPRSDAHDFALDIAEDRPGQHGMARALERFCAHVLGARTKIRPVPVIEDRNWSWHVGLDVEATGIANDLWHGKKVAQARLARILWLGVLEFEDASQALARLRGKPVYLALAMDASQVVRMKPQNLLTGLPLAPPS